MEERRYLWKIIRDTEDGHGVDVVGYVRMQPPCTLAGQVVPSFIDAFASLALAKSEYPEAIDCTGGQCPAADTPSDAHLPDELDPVPGGAYPDDWTDRVEAGR